MTLDTASYEVSLKGGYIYLKLKGDMTEEVLNQSTAAVLDLAKEQNIPYLLDDIREVSRNSVSPGVQARAIANLWKLRSFKKIALVFSDQEIGRLALSTLQLIHLPLKCRVFDDEAAAIAWLSER